MLSSPTRMTEFRYHAILFLAALIIGTFVRFYHLGERPITHPEFYAAGLEIPEFVKNPPPRHTVTDILYVPLVHHHPHLPGYELITYHWNRAFDTELYGMRIFSVLFGIFSLIAIYAFARATTDRNVALLSMWLLALHGHHIFWSQTLRPWVIMGLLALLTAWLLVKLAKRWRFSTAILYILLAATGLWIDTYFWPVFAAQIAWAILRNGGNRRPSALMTAQLVALILALPVLLYVYSFLGVYTPVTADIWGKIYNMLQYGGILNMSVYMQDRPQPFILSFLVFVVGAVLLVVGVRPAHTGNGETLPGQGTTQPGLAQAAILFTASLIPLFVLHDLYSELYSGRLVYRALQLAPFLMLALWAILYYRYRPVGSAITWLTRTSPVGTYISDLPNLLALLPFTLLAVIHLYKPVMADYGLVTLAPFFIILISRAIMSFVLPVRLALIAFSFAVFVYSTISFYETINDQSEYDKLPALIIPHIEDNDRIAIPSKWWIVPVTYYMKPSRFNIVSLKAARAELESGPSGDISAGRYWVIDYCDSKKCLDDRIDDDLKVLSESLVELRRFYAGYGCAVLLERKQEHKTHSR